LKTIDAATVLAGLSCALVFAAWLVLPHRAATPAAPSVALREREGVTTAA
jgi:hypothetical protein